MVFIIFVVGVVNVFDCKLLVVVIYFGGNLNLVIVFMFVFVCGSKSECKFRKGGGYELVSGNNVCICM